MKKILTLNICLSFLLLLRAQTYIPGGTITGATWDWEGSPYVVQGDVTIEDLTIHAGVVVLFDGNFISCLIIILDTYHNSK